MACPSDQDSENPYKPGVAQIPISRESTSVKTTNVFSAKRVWLLFIDVIGAIILLPLGGEFTYQLTRASINETLILVVLSFIPSIAFLVLRNFVKIGNAQKRLGWWACMGLTFLGSIIVFWFLATLIQR